jgi:5-methyltetrahydrofolate--homocysteine methyltransferase
MLVKTILRGASKEVTISTESPTVIIGERINLSGRKSLIEALLNGNLEPFCLEAMQQVIDGADIIDINVGAAGGDEPGLLSKVVAAVAKSVEVPLCLDSSNPDALEAALKVCPGKALINSVNASKNSLDPVLSLAHKYKAAVIALLQNDDGIPKDVDARILLARQMLERADYLQVPREDVVLDCLALSIATDENSAILTFETIKRDKSEIGVNTVLGASNISFGLPSRDIINSTYIAAAIANGLTCLIGNAARVRQTVLAADLLLGRDKYAKRFISNFRKSQVKTN